MRNFFVPNININGEPYAAYRYRQIIEEQVSISYASKGISIADTDELTPYDRKLILDSIIKIKDEEKKAIEESRKKADSIRSSRPRTTSRYSRR